ncbi:FAD-dependent monooxygenase [Streptomyces sp. NPDC053048]|uniref:FAD-dependent monooxygenase n=1 Tax=Streptomyces sp. NPDC053048 TaxID=3365694 RepID=UPI0037D08A26
MRNYETDVLVVGAGPVGMALALDLRYRGVDFMMVEASDGSVPHPKVGTVGPRSMELFRRWGVAGEIRSAGWPADHPLDIAWVTALGGHEIHRLDFGTAATRPELPYTPEPEQVCPQHWLSPLLARRVGVHPDGPLRRRCRAEGARQDAEGVTVTVTDLGDGTRLTVRARYVVACDGASSPLRKAARIAAPARHATQVYRNILFRAPGLRELLGDRGALVHFLTQPGALRFPLRSMDGRELYRLTAGGSQVLDGEALDLVRSAIAFDIPLTIVSENVWYLTHRVAETYRDGRLLLAGDAAHTLSPSGGFGMNTGIVDAADLGWKLAGELAGWAGPGLLDAYDTERRPVAMRSLEEANANLVRTVRRELPEEITQDTPQGARARAELSAALERSPVRREFAAPDVHFGYRYDSPLIAGGAGQAGDWRDSALPGGRAPHAWLAPGRSTLDLFGPGFHLLCGTQAEEAGLKEFEAAFARRGVPLETTHWDEQRAPEHCRGLCVLVRPDGHVAWRGTAPPADPGELADTVRGAR